MKQKGQAEFILQMAIDLLMDKTVKMGFDAAHMDINAIKFRVFRAMALCKL